MQGILGKSLLTRKLLVKLMLLFTTLDLLISALSFILGSIFVISGVYNDDDLLASVGGIYLLTMAPHLIAAFGLRTEFMWFQVFTRLLAFILGLYIAGNIIWLIGERRALLERIKNLNELEKYAKECYLKGYISEDRLKEVLFELGLQRKELMLLAKRRPLKEVCPVIIRNWFGLKTS